MKIITKIDNKNQIEKKTEKKIMKGKSILTIKNVSKAHLIDYKTSKNSAKEFLQKSRYGSNIKRVNPIVNIKTYQKDI